LGDTVRQFFGGTPSDPKTPSGESGHLEAVREVWFAGTHADVGGSAVKDGESSLADAPFEWMVEEVKLSDCEIKFKKPAPDTADTSIPISVLGVSPARDSGFEASPQTPPDVIHTEKEKDVEPEPVIIHDVMKSNPLWSLLELVPTRVAWQDETGKWRSKWM
jgi:hypothetical protein